jgi:hypothetical protein
LALGFRGPNFSKRCQLDVTPRGLPSTIYFERTSANLFLKGRKIVWKISSLWPGPFFSKWGQLEFTSRGLHLLWDKSSSLSCYYYVFILISPPFVAFPDVSLASWRQEKCCTFYFFQNVVSNMRSIIKNFMLFLHGLSPILPLWVVLSTLSIKHVEDY